MLDFRRATAQPAVVRFALAALATTLCLLAGASAARAATGELAAFGVSAFPPAADGEFIGAGPAALDGSSLYVADLDGNVDVVIRKLSRSGALQAKVTVPAADASGHPLYVVGLAVDPALHRLYALADFDGHGLGAARKVLVFDTTPECTTPADPHTCTLPDPATTGPLSDGVLFDFTGDAAHAVDFASGLAVDPGTHDVAVLGVDDSSAGDPSGVLQYIGSNGTAGTRFSGFGAGLDPDGAQVRNPSALGIAPDGGVFVATAQFPSNGIPYTDGWTSESVYRLPRGGGAATLVLTSANAPRAWPGAVDFGGADNRRGSGASMALSADGSRVYLISFPGAMRVRGYSTATGAPEVVYGGGTSACRLGQAAGMGIAAGAGNDLLAVTTDVNLDPNAGAIVHLFGDGGSGCPVVTGAFKANNLDTGTINVVKGLNVSFDASGSQLAGGTVTKVLWDFDGNGSYETEAAGLTTAHKFTATGDVTVGMKVETDSGISAPVTHALKVTAPVPTAAFKASTRTPAAGATVSFDAGDSIDPAGGPGATPSNALAKYTWDFGDGSPKQETTTPTIGHAFANAATTPLARTVRLTVTSADGVTSAAAQQTITVAGTPASGGPGPEQPKPQPQPQPQPKPQPPALPAPALSGPAVDAKGTLSVKVACPAGGAACTGKLELTVKVKQKVKGKAKTVTVKLGTASFDVAAGQSKAIKLKLSAKGRSLLKRQRRLSAVAAVTVTAGGQSRTSNKTLSLKAPAKRK
jgi:PKD repeat protein